MESFDLVVVGGGVIGCATIRAALKKHPDLSALLIESEPELAVHQSGRNSGVIHAGFNQKPGTMKARFVVEGNRRLREFCLSQNIPLKQDGILVLATNEQQKLVLEELLSRGEANGATVALIGRESLEFREPHCLGVAALFASEGSSFDARSYVLALANEAKQAGATVSKGETVVDLKEESDGVLVGTKARSIKAKLVVCAGGIQADRLAHRMGLGLKYAMVPFRGEYHELIPEKRHMVRTHLYPAPNLKFPFLGVHLSCTFDDRVLVGPGAVLAMGRLSYTKRVVNLKDMAEMASRPGFWKLWLSEDFRQVAATEFKKSFYAKAVADEAANLVKDLKYEDLQVARSGIRAQLVGNDGQLVDDLVVEESRRTIHVLNAVSPALTCSLPFADSICEKISAKLASL